MEAVEKLTLLREGESFIQYTKSLCPECISVIDAVIFERDNKVYIRKFCEKHGYFEEIYWGDYELYMKARKFAHDGNGVENPNVNIVNCPYTCGLCPIHKSHSALVNMVVTNRCDLACWYCFFYAKKAGYVYEPTLEQIEEMFKVMKNQKPIPANAVQLTGGEPTLRDDLVEIVKLAKKYGIEHVQLNSNGIRLAKDPTLAKKLREAGVNTLYLSFDGVSPKTNPKNHWEVPKVLENCRKAGLGIVLVPTVIKSVNDHEVWKIVEFALDNIDIVRGVNFQPVSLVGRMSKREREKYRITIPDVIKRLEEQSNGILTREDFYPVPYTTAITHFVEAITKEPYYELSNHFACGMATYLFKEDGKVIPVTRFVDVEGLYNFLNELSEELRKGRSRLIVGFKLISKISKFIDKKNQPKSINFAKILYNVLIKHDYSTLGEFHSKTLFIGMMHFQDLYNYDLERIMRCNIHYVTPDRRLIPFCTFNVLPELYRDKIQEKYSISIEEWEKRTGRKLEDDLYRRIDPT